MIEQTHGRAALRAVPAALVMAAAGGTWLYTARSFIAEDSYFYLVIARRLALEHHQTFSGVFPTNGFHPLWLYLLAAYATIVGEFQPSLLWQANFAVPLSIVLVALAAFALLKIERVLRLPAGTLVLPPVVYVMVTGVLYSEGHLLLAVIAWLGWLIVSMEHGQPVRGSVFGCALAAVVLARLDMVFLGGAAFIWAVLRERRRVKWVGWMAAVCGLLLGPYLAANWWFFGGIMPVSGWLKSSFPVPTPTGFQGRWGSLSLSEYSVATGVIPVALGIVVSLATAWRRTGPALLPVLTVGALGHMAYTMLFASWCGWRWYYVLAVVVGSLAWSVVLRDSGAMGRGMAPIQAVALSTLAVVVLTYEVKRDNRNPPMFAIQQYLSSPEAAGRTVFVSELPGEGAFLGRANVVAADMLTASRQLYSRVIEAPNPWNTLLDECARAGHPLDEVVHVGGAFVTRSGDRIAWYDPRVFSRRPVVTVELGKPAVDRPAIPFTVWRLDRSGARR